MENKLELNEIVDELLKDVESTLGKLEKNFKLNQTNEVHTREQVEIEEKHTFPYPSVRYPTSDQNLKSNKHSTIIRKTTAIADTSKTEIEKIEEKNIKADDEIDVKDYEKILIAQDIPAVPKEKISSIKQSIIQYSESLATEEKPDSAELMSEEEYFLDIKREIRLVHIYGPPGSCKTTIGIQASIEIVPRKTYYFITSHGTSVLKRVKQMISDERWVDFKGVKQSFFPIEITNLDELEIQLEKLAAFNPEELGMIVVDHVTDYCRGQIYQEEKRIQLRNILEKLYLLADEKGCKVLLINGFSFKDSAPAEDIIESFCDMTIKMKIDDFKSKLLFQEEEMELKVDNSGISNLHLNIYY
ncbi:MAG: hypothetical protein ACTSO5_11930 [Candidatus Heimdallarchaeaceae archaeon]